MTIYRIINTDNPVSPAIGLADFRWKKHENLCTPFSYPTAQGSIKRVRRDKQG